jgi:hypothetical protein
MSTQTGINLGITWGFSTGDNTWGPSFNLLAETVDDLMMCGVIDSTLTAPPSSPADGDRYIVGASATGAWAGKDNKIAVWYASAWTFYTPKSGWTVRCAVKGRLDFVSGAWKLVLSDAPSDGLLYARKNGSWVAVVEEAPTDGNKYVRKNGSWVVA